MGRRFVDLRVIHQRMLRKDLRFQAAARRRLPAILAPELVPFVEVVIVPVEEAAGVVDVALVDDLDEFDQLETYAGDEGSRCGSACGYCGRCS